MARPRARTGHVDLSGGGLLRVVMRRDGERARSLARGVKIISRAYRVELRGGSDFACAPRGDGAEDEAWRRAVPGSRGAAQAS
jgi:hypothetical protein